MRKSKITLISGLLALVVFFGFLGETEGPPMFGYDVNIWVYRILWLCISISFLTKYFRNREA